VAKTDDGAVALAYVRAEVQPEASLMIGPAIARLAS
jgi:hypothetical protein